MGHRQAKFRVKGSGGQPARAQVLWFQMKHRKHCYGHTHDQHLVNRPGHSEVGCMMTWYVTARMQQISASIECMQRHVSHPAHGRTADLLTPEAKVGPAPGTALTSATRAGQLCPAQRLGVEN